MDIQNKTCNKCDNSLPIQQFYCDKKGKVSAYCKPCIKVHNKEWRAKQDPVQRREKARERRNKLKAEVLISYGHKCACCGEAIADFLTIDHVNNDGAQHRREVGGEMWLEVLRLGCPKDRFQLLCFNCNIAKGLFGTCPHARRGRRRTVS